MGDPVITHWSKPKECPAPRVSPDVSCGLRVRICYVDSLAVADAPSDGEGWLPGKAMSLWRKGGSQNSALYGQFFCGSETAFKNNFVTVYSFMYVKCLPAHVDGHYICASCPQRMEGGGGSLGNDCEPPCRS